MKIGKSDLTKEELEKLLKAVAKEEAAAGTTVLSDAEMAEEEQQLAKRLQTLTDKKLSHVESQAIGSEDEDIAGDQLRRERNLQAIKTKLAEMEQASDSDQSLEPHSPGSFISKRWVQISSFLAVAALLAIVVRTLPEHTPRAPVGPDAVGTRFKGEQVDVADCDYSVLQDMQDLERLDGLQTRFLASKDGSFEVVIKCVPAEGFVHAVALSEEGPALLAKNIQIETSQRQFLRVRDQTSDRLVSPFWAEGLETTILLILTKEEIGVLEATDLPDSLNVETLGDQAILWADEFLVIMDGEEAVE